MHLGVFAHEQDFVDKVAIEIFLKLSQEIRAKNLEKSLDFLPEACDNSFKVAGLMLVARRKFYSKHETALLETD